MAGLLDILSAGDNSGGLLDLLRRSAMQQQMPSGLASDQAQYDSAPIFPMQAAPSQQQVAQAVPQIAGPNTPSPLDTAQWPVGPVGAPSNAMAQMPVASPQAAAQPAQAQGPSIQPVLSQSPTPDFGDRLVAGLQGFANGGALLPALANGITGLATGQRSDKVGIAQQSVNMTARALLAKGVDPAAVQAAITNPELMKTLITQAYGPQTVQSLGNGYVWDQKQGKAVKAYEPDSKKTFVKFKDANGQEVPGIFDPDANDGKGGFTPVNAATPSAQNTGSLQDALKAGVTGDDLYQYLPPDRARTVKAMIEGRMPPPSTTAMRSPATMQLIDAANAIDPNFDATTWKSRSTFNQQFGSQAPSSIGGQKVLMSTALGHLAEVAGSAAELNNSDGSFTGLAPVGHTINSIKNQTTKQAAIANAMNDKVAKFSGEVGKLYSGSQGGGVHEREDTRNRLGSNLTSAELAAGLEASKDLILSKQKALEDQTAQIFGPDRAKKFDFVGPEGRDAIEKIDKAIAQLRGQGAPSGSSTPAPTPAATAAPDRSAIEAEMKKRGLL